MMDKKVWVLAILAIFGLTACATTQSGLKGPSLPNDINIIAPSSDLRKDIAAFSGKWVGTWEVGTEIILVVKEIDDTWAHVIYSGEIILSSIYKPVIGVGDGKSSLSLNLKS